MSRRFRSYTGTCVLFLLCMLAGCRGSGSSPNAEDTPDSTTDTTVTSPDAVDTSRADTATASTDENTPPSSTPPGPAPGTAHVRAIVPSCDTKEASPQCQIQIRKVLGYGSATPPLSRGERVVRLLPQLLTDWRIDSLAAEGPHTLVLRHAGDQPAIQEPSDENRPEWTIESVQGPESTDQP